MRSRLPMFMKVWFGLDLVLSLFPPIHWAVSGSAPVFGAPIVLVYIFGVSAFVALSLVVAYLADRGADRAGA